MLKLANFNLSRRFRTHQLKFPATPLQAVRVQIGLSSQQHLATGNKAGEGKFFAPPVWVRKQGQISENYFNAWNKFIASPYRDPLLAT